MKLLIKIKLTHANAKVPTRATLNSNAYDLYSIDNYELNHNERKPIKTGIHIQIPDGYVGLVCPRSGLAIKQGLTAINAPGIIDSDYRGEVNFLAINHGGPQHVEQGDRVGQILFLKTEEAEFLQVEKLDDTERGEGGLGSTGVK